MVYIPTETFFEAKAHLTVVSSHLLSLAQYIHESSHTAKDGLAPRLSPLSRGRAWDNPIRSGESLGTSQHMHTAKN